MNTWIIYDHPRDFPDDFVARRFGTGIPTDDVIVGPLEALREHLENLGLVRIARHPTDDAVIVETWL